MKKEVAEAKLKKYSANQLISKIEGGKLSKVELEIAIAILKKRGKDTSKYEEVDKLAPLRKEVDSLIDSLIELKRNGVYTQVMKALGGSFSSDLDELLMAATKDQLEEALSFGNFGKEKETEEEPKEEPVQEPEKPESEKKDTVNKTTTTRGPKILESKELEGLKAGVTVSFTLNKKRGGAETTGEMVRVHQRGDKEYILIKLEDGTIVSKRPSALVIVK